MPYSYGLAVAIANSDNDIMLAISYYVDLDEAGRLVHIYEVRKSLIFDNAEQFFSYRKNIAKMNLFESIAVE